MNVNDISMNDISMNNITETNELMRIIDMLNEFSNNISINNISINNIIINDDISVNDDISLNHNDDDSDNDVPQIESSSELPSLQTEMQTEVQSEVKSEVQSEVQPEQSYNAQPAMEDNRDSIVPDESLLEVAPRLSYRNQLMHEMFDNIFNILNGNSINRNRNRNRIIRSEDVILNESFQNDCSVYKNVISDKGKEELKTVHFSKENNSIINDTCPILHTQFEEGEEITQLPCNHFFDTTAIMNWLENEKAECPVCRYKLHNKEIKIKIYDTEPGVTGPSAQTQNAQGITGPYSAQADSMFMRMHMHSNSNSNNHINIDNEDMELQMAILNSISRQR
jgi:hypothetical protein